MSARTHASEGAPPDQLYFSFVTDETRTELAEAWRSRISRQDASAVKRAEAARKRISLKVIVGKTLPIDWTKHRSVLEMPLGRYRASELDVQPAAEDDEASGLSVIASENASEEHVDDVREWSDAAIAQLHEGVLHHSLRLLEARGNAEEKFEILQWIWAHPVHSWKVYTVAGVNQYRPVYRRQLPFSFELCCAFVGMDPDRIRDGLEYILRPVLKTLGINTDLRKGELNAQRI